MQGRPIDCYLIPTLHSHLEEYKNLSPNVTVLSQGGDGGGGAGSGGGDEAGDGKLERAMMSNTPVEGRGGRG